MADLKLIGIDSTTGQAKLLTSSNSTDRVSLISAGTGTTPLTINHSGGTFGYASLAVSSSGTMVTDVQGVGGTEFRFKDTSAGTDEKNWRFINAANSFKLASLNDAYSAEFPVFTTYKTGATPVLFDMASTITTRFGGASALTANVVMYSGSGSINALRVEGGSTIPAAVFITPTNVPPIRFTNLTSASTTSTGLAPLGVDSSGNVKITDAPLYGNGADTTLFISAPNFGVDQSYAFNWTSSVGHVFNPGAVATRAIHIAATLPVTNQAKDSHFIQFTGIGRNAPTDTTADWRLFVDTLTIDGASNFVINSGIDNSSYSPKLTILGIGGIRLPVIENAVPNVGDIWLDNVSNELKSTVSSGNTRFLTGNIRNTGNYDISAATNNLNTGNSEIVKLNNTQGFALDLTGMVAGIEGQVKFVTNVSGTGNEITIKHNSSSSSAANRFRCSTNNDIILTLNKTLIAWYDSIVQAWRIS